MKMQEELSGQPVDRRRRDLVRAATLTLLGVLGGACSRIATREATGLPAWLTGVIHDPAAAADLGRGYLAMVPHERQPDRLLERIVDALSPRLGMVPGSVAPPEVAQALRMIVRDEYATAQVVEVDGWLLAQTEARLYAAVAL